MRKILVLALWGIGILAGLIFILWFSFDREEPEGKQGKEAELLADQMLDALNYEAYQSITNLSWSFKNIHQYDWDKSGNTVLVRWDGMEVDLDLETLRGTATRNGLELEGSESNDALLKAWEFFANDSFWLVAPYKIRDPGTVRSLVIIDEKPALKITYTSGGVTPGDSYLWILDENYLPTHWRMWVGILPVGGLEFTWQNWEEHGGAYFAPDHIGPFGINISITDIKVN